LVQENKNRKRSVTVAGHRTSVTLEGAFWGSLKEIADKRGKSINTLIAELDQTQPENLSSALRVFILNHYKTKIL
jgi:predicted DNA-binding ribbon-helix-helix protein